MNKQRILILATAALGLVASWLPWAYVSIPVLKINETNRGILVFLLLIAPVVLALVGDKSTLVEGRKKIACIILGALAALWSLYKIVGFSSELKAAAALATSLGGKALKISGSLGVGPYIALIAGIALVAGAILGEKLDEKTA